jgi:hypothetical protein
MYTAATRPWFSVMYVIGTRSIRLGHGLTSFDANTNFYTDHQLLRHC